MSRFRVVQRAVGTDIYSYFIQRRHFLWGWVDLGDLYTGMVRRSWYFGSVGCASLTDACAILQVITKQHDEYVARKKAEAEWQKQPDKVVSCGKNS